MAWIWDWDATTMDIFWGKLKSIRQNTWNFGVETKREKQNGDFYKTSNFTKTVSLEKKQML